MKTERTITSNEGDRLVIRPNWLIMLLFGKVILNTVRAVINRSKERGHIDSRSFHELIAMTDRALK
jgi:hypothetical protein